MGPRHALLIAVGVFVAIAAILALHKGIEETRLSFSGPRKDLFAEELSSDRHGWVAAFGCVRHDQAVVVTTSGEVYRLGDRAPSADGQDRVYTPLSSQQDCDEGHPPRQVYALIEDEEEVASSTLTHTSYRQVTPPPIAAMVDGVIGFSPPHPREADAAVAHYRKAGLSSGGVLLQKGRRPGLRWVALVTAGAGIHGLVLLGAGLVMILRRLRRARDPFDEEEQTFFGGETLE